MESSLKELMARLTNQVVDNIRPACKKCGYPGHFTYQCRNFLKINPDKDIVLDISSTSSETEEEFMSPLTKLKGLLKGRPDETKGSGFKSRRRHGCKIVCLFIGEEEEAEKRKKHKHRKHSKHKKHRSRSPQESDSGSESDVDTDTSSSTHKHKKKKHKSHKKTHKKKKSKKRE
ncbi:protein SREK1IP1-like isoform X2 [Stegodyphus dumicola]|uniref:protein SREK1IP1-like isoform X2 n=1 Tax=Stegodyphus dumicola TaxID=202533 RepID=UPI0015ABF739|nr:protein SREK1IP1-like isoform X2 [Stegodyphus dumicola]